MSGSLDFQRRYADSRGDKVTRGRWNDELAFFGVARDITERLRTEEALRESEEKFLTFVRHSPYGYVETDLEGKLVFVNRRRPTSTVMRRKKGSASTSPATSIRTMCRAVANLQAVARGVLAEPHEYMAPAKDGSIRYIEMSSLPRRKGGQLVGFQSTMLDITRRKNAERALREHDAKLSTLFANLPDVVATVDRNAALQYLNRGGPQAVPEELLGAKVFGFLAPESQAAAHEGFARAVATRQVQPVEVLDIYGVWWACRLVPMIEEDEVRSVMIICTDVSEQRKAAEAVKKEQQLLRQLIDLHERDRQVIAYEIHDGFAQQLTAASYGFQAYERLREEMPEKAASSFESGMKLLSSSIDEARRLIGGLRPPILDEFGIVAAIEYLIHDCHTRGGPEVSFDYDVAFDRLAPPLESALFRIVQEALTNVNRHSRSAKASIGLSQADDRIHVNVRDWGVGFDPAARAGRAVRPAGHPRARAAAGRTRGDYHGAGPGNADLRGVAADRAAGSRTIVYETSTGSDLRHGRRAGRHVPRALPQLAADGRARGLDLHRGRVCPDVRTHQPRDHRHVLGRGPVHGGRDRRDGRPEGGGLPGDYRRRFSRPCPASTDYCSRCGRPALPWLSARRRRRPTSMWSWRSWACGVCSGPSSRAAT